MVVNDIPNNIERITSGYFGVILEVSAIGFVASFFDWKIFIVIFFASFVNYGINQFSEYYRRKHELSDRYELEWEMRTIDYAVEESYHHIASNGATKMLFDRFFTLKRQQIASVVKGEKIDFITRIAEQASNGSATICVKLLVGFLIFAGTGSIGLMTLVTLYMGRITRLTSQFFQTFSDRYEMIENIAILQFFLDFIDEKSKSRTNILTEAPKKIITKDLNFSYPKPAKAEVDFLDIKIATLKRILKERNDNHHLDELHAYEESRKEAIKENPTIIHDMNLAFEKGKIYGIV